MQGVIIEKNKNIYIENIVSKDIKYYVEEKQELYIIDVETNNGTIISYNDKKDYEKFDVGDTIEMKIENIYLFNKHLFYKVTDVKK